MQNVNYFFYLFLVLTLSLLRTGTGFTCEEEDDDFYFSGKGCGFRKATKQMSQEQESRLASLQMFVSNNKQIRCMRKESIRIKNLFLDFNKNLKSYRENAWEYTDMPKELLDEIEKFELDDKKHLNSAEALVKKILKKHEKIEY